MLKHWLMSGLGAIHAKFKKVAIGFAALVVVFSFGLSVVTAQPATAQVTGNPGSSFGGSVSTCAIETIGWVICPVMRTIAKLADYGFAFINQDFLRIEYELSGGDSGIVTAWELIRNIANIVLVLVFLYIVYTQITGRNTGDFNLKRILPRLMIGAVLLNLSYLICAAAIQLSNIAGSAILQGMVDISTQIGTPAMTLTNAADGFEDAILSQLVSAMLQKHGVVWVMLAPMATITIGIAVVSAVALIVLIARKVIISMLVLISPLLFVANMLPNLERYFQQWVRLFVQLLMLYPIIAFLLGTGQIVSATIISVGSGGDSDYSVEGDGYQAREGGSGSATTDLAAAGAAVLPLVGVWWMSKGLSTVMSSAGTRISAGIAGRGRSKERAGKLEAKFKQPTQTSATNVNVMGGRVNVYDKKPAFSRVPGRRRHATPGGSNLPGGAGGNKPTAPNLPTTPPQSPLGGLPLGNEPSKISQAAEQAAKKLEDLNGANINADKATATDVQAVAAAAAAGDGKDKKKSANDLFKQMNQRNKPQSPDAQRQFGTAQPAAGGGSGGGGGQSSGGGSDYRAPTASQPINVPQQSATVQRIVVAPAAIDASTLSNRAQPEMARAAAHRDVPTTELQQKAKGIAQKYIFDSARDVDDAAGKLEELTQKQDDEDKKDQ